MTRRVRGWCFLAGALSFLLRVGCQRPAAPPSLEPEAPRRSLAETAESPKETPGEHFPEEHAPAAGNSLKLAARTTPSSSGAAGETELDWVRVLTGSDETAKSRVPGEFAIVIQGLLAAQAELEFDHRGQLIGVDLAGERRSGGDNEIALAVQLPHLRRLRVAGFGTTPAGIRLLAKRETLEELGLENTQIDDASLEALAALPRLRSLNLRRSVKLTDKAVTILKAFPALTHLSLLENQFSSAALRELGQISRLRLLDLRNCAGVDADLLGQLARLPQLVDLRLRGYHIDDKCLAALAQFPRLANFTLEESPVTALGLRHLASLPLVSLTLFRCNSINDAALAEVVSHWERLHTLSLRDMPLRGEFLAQLHQSSQLRTLNLTQTMVGDSALAFLRSLPSLVELSLAQTLITDAGLEHLAGIASLERLNLSQTQVTDAGIARLGGLRHLKSLDLRGNPGITNAALDILEKLPDLEEVFLDGTSVTAAGLARLGRKAKSIPIGSGGVE